MTASRASGRILRSALLLALLAGGAAGAAAQSGGSEPAGPISLFPPTVTAPLPDGTAPGAASDAGETSESGDIQINRLGELDPDNLGILDAAHGGFGADAWAGSDRATVEAQLSAVTGALSSPTLRRLVTRLLLSSAKAPPPARSAAALTVAEAVAATQGTGFLRLRAERLYALGELEGLNQLLALVPQHVEDPWLARARVDGLLLAGRDEAACSQVPAGLARYPQELYWAKAQVFCQFAGEQTDQALLGLDLLREQAPDSDPAFFAAANAFIGGGSGAVDTGGLSPLTLAMLRRAGADLPPDLAQTVEPLLLHGLAGLPGDDHALRADATERLVQLGALPGERLAGAYDAFDFTVDEMGNALAEAERVGSVRGRALLFRAARRESLSATRAEILRAAFLSAEADGRSAAMSRAALPVMTELAPTPDLAWFAPLAARTLYRAGQFERAGAWLSVLRVDGQSHPESQEAYAGLRPLLRLAGGAEPLAADTARAAGQRLLLFVLSRALGQDEDVAWVEAAGTASAEPLQRVPRLLALGDAAAAGQGGGTVLLTVAALGPEAPAGNHPLALGYAVSALSAVGLGGDARALAIEAALAAGL
jgi:hypothetical protein